VRAEENTQENTVREILSNSDGARMFELRDRLLECISLAQNSAAGRRQENREIQHAIAFLWAALDSLDHHQSKSRSALNKSL
jgi:hypothetical protein